MLCTLNSYAYLFNLIILSFSLVKSSRVIGTGTFGCGTIIVEGEDFIAENITFENSAPQVLVFALFFFLLTKLVLLA